jgi:hypothetical protein
MDIKKPILRGTGTGKKSTAIRRGHDATRALFPSGTGISHGPLGTSFRPTQAQPQRGSSTLTWLD